MRAACLTDRLRATGLISVVVVLCLAITPSRGFAQGQVNRQLTAPNPAADARKAGQALSPRQIMALKQVVYHERRAMVLLERARQHLDDNELSLAFDALQSLLGDPQELLSPSQDWTRAPSDSFFLTDGRLHSIRHEALRLFESLNREQLEFYEKKYSEIANRALQAARESGQSAAYLEVARRCFPTRAGAQATDEAATRLLDRGETALAARLWLRLIESNIHRRRLTSRLFEKAAIALILSGDEPQAERVIKSAQSAFGSVSFSAESIRAAARQYPQRPQLVMNDAARSPFGGPSNNSISQGSVPYLAPVWTQPLYANRPFELLANWEQDRASNELKETGVAVFPLIAADQLIVRDLQGIRSCDPQTGRLLWRFNATLPVRRFVSELREAEAGRSASLIETAWTENSSQGIVTSDGKRVFAIDWLDFEPIGQQDRSVSVQASNRLVCLEIPASAAGKQAAGNESAVTVNPVWTVGGTASDGPLSDQLFLGAPRPIDDALFVITESRRDRELNLVKLEAATGRVAWVQKIGLVQQPSFNATQRARNLPMALPAVADGIVICQPDAEIIVAVDASHGELKWIYAYGRDSFMGGRSRGTLRISGGGFRGFPSTPVIHRQSVICLPQHSEEVHCLDLATGQQVWKVARDEDSYLATATDDIVASVGKHGMRGLSLKDGSVQWTARTGIPSGRGVRLEDEYIIPLKSGGIASVDLRTGLWTKSSIVPELARRRYEKSRTIDDGKLTSAREHDLALFGLDDEQVSDEVRPGNLLFHDGLVFSVGPQHLTAFSEVLNMLRKLQQQAAQGQPVDELLVAQLEVSAGRQDAATTRLTKLIAALDRSSDRTKAEVRTADRAKWLLRELIIRRLNQDRTVLTASQQREMIEELARLSEHPLERGYALIEQAHWQAENVSPVRAVDFARRAIDTGLDSFIPTKGSPDCFMTADAFARNLVRKSLETTQFPARAQLQDLIERDMQVAVSLDTIDSLSHFLKLYSATREAGRIRNRLADRLAMNGRVQEAELLLLQNRSHSDSEVQAVAEALLISLWSRLQLSYEAGAALYGFSNRFPETSLAAVREDRLETIMSVLARGNPDAGAVVKSDELTGADFVRLFAGDESARKVFRDLHPLDWKVRRITVSQHTQGASNPLLKKLWSGAPRRVVYGQRSEFDIVRGSNGLQSWWQILDRIAGTERGRIVMPARMTMPGAQGYHSVGHLMPVGTPAGMQSVSLLEYHDERPFWKLRFPPLDTESSQSLIEPGPATPSVCVFQTRKHLFGVDPASGRILWRRSDLDLASGVQVDREAGLFGDEQVLVMFHADKASYTLFKMQTGEIIRKDRLDIDFGYPHRVIGRKLFHVTRGTGNTGKRIRIWDPLTGNMDLDEEIIQRFNPAWSTDGELALITTDTRLRVFSPDASKVLVDLELSPEETSHISSLRVFTDDRNIYVNLQRSEVAGNSNKIYSLASDSVVPVDHVHRGLLIAISRNNGKLLWKTPVQQRSFVRIDRGSLPFLVGLSRVSPRRGSNLRSLEIRVIDQSTGEDFLEPVSLIQDKIVHYQIDRDAGELQLYGIDSRIDLSFQRLRKQFPLQEQPL